MSETLCTPTATKEFVDDKALHDWLNEQAKTHQLNYLLAHADDGVIWGRFDEGELTTAEQVFRKPEFDFPSLRLLTLQQCRVFGRSGEVLLWRTGEKWRSRLVQENDTAEIIPEQQILWGTQKERESEGFTLLSDGQQGLRHAVPLLDITFDKNNKLHRPLRLSVYHYIDYDDSGLARISRSRLVNLTTEQELINAFKTPQKSSRRP